MRIVIVCSCAEPGRDGVGDYSRVMANELTNMGNTVALLAFSDKLLASDIVVDSTEIRLSSGLPPEKRILAAREFITSFQPDVLSLQYVNYGFHNKGLPFSLCSELNSLSDDIPWHIYFHELWIENRGHIVRRVFSILQKRLLVNLCQKLKPRLVHVSNFYYHKRLLSLGITSNIIPVQSSIPLCYREPKHKCNKWTFVFFGSLRNCWDLKLLFQQIEKARIIANKKECCFISVGRIGAYGDNIFEKMKGYGYKSFKFEKLGELSPQDVSFCLQRADFGIAMSPLYLLSKSSSVAAMWEHDLPVIASPVLPRNVSHKCFSEYFNSFMGPVVVLDGKFVDSLVSPPRNPCFRSFPRAADLFMESLGAAL